MENEGVRDAEETKAPPCVTERYRTSNRLVVRR